MKAAVIAGACWKWGFWVRVAGRGISVSTAPPLFSERAGLRKCVRVLGVKFEYLPRDVEAA